jgi:hypothetical protein
VSPLPAPSPGLNENEANLIPRDVHQSGRHLPRCPVRPGAHLPLACYRAVSLSSSSSRTASFPPEVFPCSPPNLNSVAHSSKSDINKVAREGFRLFIRELFHSEDAFDDWQWLRGQKNKTTITRSTYLCCWCPLCPPRSCHVAFDRQIEPSGGWRVDWSGQISTRSLEQRPTR